MRFRGIGFLFVIPVLIFIGCVEKAKKKERKINPEKVTSSIVDFSNNLFDPGQIIEGIQTIGLL